MKYNDSLKLIAQFECEGNILTSRATEFEIRQIVDVDDTAFEKATTSTGSDMQIRWIIVFKKQLHILRTLTATKFCRKKNFGLYT